MRRAVTVALAVGLSAGIAACNGERNESAYKPGKPLVTATTPETADPSPVGATIYELGCGSEYYGQTTEFTAHVFDTDTDQKIWFGSALDIDINTGRAVAIQVERLAAERKISVQLLTIHMNNGDPLI